MLKEYKTIVLKEINSNAILKLNRPNKLNAFNMQMLDDMLDAIERVNKDDNIKSLIITGTGRAFVQEQIFHLVRKLLIKILIQKHNMSLMLDAMREAYSI